MENGGTRHQAAKTEEIEAKKAAKIGCSDLGFLMVQFFLNI
jgi:hypothetical protein